jgi:hypothetical protein
MTEEEALGSWQWNETATFPSDLRPALVSIVGLTDDQTPIQIGTGFVIQANGDRATILTAAHNISEGIRQLQYPHQRYHPSTPREFLPPEDLSAGSAKIRVLIQTEDGVDASIVSTMMWDEQTDLAILTVVPQEAEMRSLFTAKWWIGARDPVVGDVVVTAAFADLTTENLEEKGKGLLKRRPLLRAGRVAHVHREGFHRHQTACIETTIPAFSGMSGAPIFIMPTAEGERCEVFGLLSSDFGESSDPAEDKLAKMDRSKAGASIFRLLPRQIRPLAGGRQEVGIAFTASEVVHNPELDQQRFANDLLWRPH